MITAGDFRKGVTIELDGNVFNIVDFQHVKPGKGAAFVRTKIKNVMTGAVLERTFNPTDKVPRAVIETKEMTYLYNDGDFYYFMDVDTYEQIPLGQDVVEDAIHYVKENTNVTVHFFKGTAFSVEASSPSRWSTPSPASAAILRPTSPSPRLWRPAMLSPFRFSSTRVRRSASIPVPASTWSARKSGILQGKNL